MDEKVNKVFFIFFYLIFILFLKKEYLNPTKRCENLDVI